MTRGQLKAIFLTLGILVLAYAAVRLGGGADRATGGSRDIGGTVTADLDLIRIGGRGQEPTVELSRTGDRWTVNGYPADTALVHEAVAALDTARAGRLVARSAANHARLGVTDDSSRLVEIRTDTEGAVRFHLGNLGLDGHFVRFVGEDEVYVVPEVSVGMLDRRPEDWRDRRVAAVDTAAIIRIALRYRDGDRRTVLSRSAADSTSVWSENGVAADTVPVRRILETVADLLAQSFPSDSMVFAADFGDPAAELDLHDSDRPEAPPVLSLLFLPAPDTVAFLVKRADDPLVYLLSERQIANLLPGRARLFPEEP